MTDFVYPDNDKALFFLCRQLLYPAVVGDILDEFGYQNQFLPSGIKPIDPSWVLVGRAMTVHEEDGIDEENPFGVMFEALDNLREDEIYICNGNLSEFAQWGGLMTTRARHLKAAGAVLGGLSRDTKEILSLGFPVFSSGTYSKDQKVRGHVDSFRRPISFSNGVVVNDGDLIFGDRDGVLIVPRTIERDVLGKAFAKATAENHVRSAIISGMSTVEAFSTYGVI